MSEQREPTEWLTNDQRRAWERMVIESWPKGYGVSVRNIRYPRREFAITGTHYEKRSSTTVIHLAEPIIGPDGLDELKPGMIVSFDDDPYLTQIIRVYDEAVSIPWVPRVEHPKILVRAQQEQFRMLSGALDFVPAEPPGELADVTEPLHCPFCQAPITGEPDVREGEYGEYCPIDCQACNRSFAVWHEEWQAWLAGKAAAT